MSLFPAALMEKAAAILVACTARGLKVATVESCTGGLLASVLTELPGSSAMFTHGFVTYANAAKAQMVGVSMALIEQHGAVSEPVARAMAEGGLSASGADIAIAITGVAGPGGGSAEKPVGTVHFTCAMRGGATMHAHLIFDGDRSAIRLAAAEHALGMMVAALTS
jgi:nicotinamide-nucleotide amidase